MLFSIKIGDSYLVDFVVNAGFSGHTQLGSNETMNIIIDSNPVTFTSVTVGNKIKEVIELMRFGDIETQPITIQEVK